MEFKVVCSGYHRGGHTCRDRNKVEFKGGRVYVQLVDAKGRDRNKVEFKEDSNNFNIVCTFSRDRNKVEFKDVYLFEHDLNERVEIETKWNLKSTKRLKKAQSHF